MKKVALADLVKDDKLIAALAKVDEIIVSKVTEMNSSVSGLNERLGLGGGKRLRPSLAIITSSGAKDRNQIIHAAAALELLHLSSLVHDDVIDDSPMRWGQTTISRKTNISTAILAGDYLIAQAFSEAALAGAKVVDILAVAFARMCEGQSMELASAYDSKRSLENYLEVCELKTGSLFSAACSVGALVAGLPDTQITALSEFGEYLGAAFQILDDILDLVSTSAELGKPTGQDFKNGTYTLPIILARKIFPKEIGQRQLVKELQRAGVFDTSINQAIELNSKAKTALKPVDDEALITLLNVWPDTLLHHCMSKQHVLGPLS